MEYSISVSQGPLLNFINRTICKQTQYQIFVCTYIRSDVASLGESAVRSRNRQPAPCDAKRKMAAWARIFRTVVPEKWKTQVMLDL